MALEISEYYKNKGFVKLYVSENKEPRRVASLVNENGNIKTMSYAKYIYTSAFKCDIDKGIEVDHINGDKLDDRIENLQLLTKADNIRKSHKKKEMVILTCPICGKQFEYEKRNLSTHPNPCCSRKCGGIKSHKNIETHKNE